MPYTESAIETKCPNPLCDHEFTRVTYMPGAFHCAPSWETEGERFGECPGCGVELEELHEAVAKYRIAREAYMKADEASDRAFRNWWHRSRSGATTNASRATGLANVTNYRSADLSGAESGVWRSDVDPRDIDKADGIDALVSRAV